MTRISATWLTSDNTQSLFELFSNAGYELFAVGGCVRNSLLAEPVADIDMATNARPDQVIDLAQDAGLKTIPTGIDHGTVTVLVQEVPFEITSYRTDTDTDGRHAIVSFSQSWQEDAQRRDFTMNALYADAAGHVHDCVDGIAHLKDRHVKFIGDATQRINEDYLRILRFFRFYAWYGDPENGIDADGLAACSELAEGLDTLSRERVGAEMRKLLSAPDPAPAIAAMAQSGVLMRLMPGADPMTLTVLVHLENGSSPSWIRRALALGGEDISDAWRLSRNEAKVLALGKTDLDAQTSISEMAYRHGAGYARDIALVNAASLQQPLSDRAQVEINRAANAIFPIKAADLMPDLAGPQLGEKLKDLEAQWIASDFKLSRTELLKL